MLAEKLINHIREEYWDGCDCLPGWESQVKQTEMIDVEGLKKQIESIDGDTGKVVVMVPDESDSDAVRIMFIAVEK